MGPSGSGKSTLLHCLAGILVPDSGEIRFDGQRVDAMAETERSALRRRRFGFVFQFGQLVPELTAEENVALPLLLGGVRRADALNEARPWFGRLGLDGMEPRRSGELSGGEAQRVALARGLVVNPRSFVCRRAHGVTRFAHRRARDGPTHRGCSRTRHHGCSRHARTARRCVRRPRSGRPRRAGEIAVDRSAQVVIRLGLRLTFNGGKEAAVRLVVTAAATALGVGLLLIALAGSTRSTRRMLVTPGSRPATRPARARSKRGRDAELIPNGGS